MRGKCKPPAYWLTGEQFSAKATKAKGHLHESAYYQMSWPIVWTQLLLARLPFGIQSGRMTFRLLSLPVVYCALIIFLCGFALVFYSDQISNRWVAPDDEIIFSSAIYNTGTSLQVPLLVLSVFSWFFEGPKIVRNYNRMANLEMKISELGLFPIVERTTRRVVTFVFGSYALSFLLIGCTTMRTLYSDVPWLFLVALVLTFSSYHTCIIMWCYSFIFVRHLAMKLKKYTLLSLRPGHERPRELRIAHKTWICLSDLSFKLADSIGVTMITILIGYGTTVVISTYGLVVTAIGDLSQVPTVAPYSLFSLLHVIALIEVAHQMTCTLGDAFLLALSQTNKDPLDRENCEEVDRFISTIVRTGKAKVTLKGFVTVDRTLLVSFMSYTVTYLIVLLQFRDTKQHSQHFPVVEPFVNATYHPTINEK